MFAKYAVASLLATLAVALVVVGKRAFFSNPAETSSNWGSVSYTVDLIPNQPEQIVVTLSLQRPADSGEQKMLLWAVKQMDLQSFVVTDGEGQVVPHEQEKSDHLEKIEFEIKNVARCQYRVRVGKEYANPQQGKFTGRQLGRKTDSYILLSGANVFLIPEDLSGYQVEVTFENLKPQWQIVTDLEADGESIFRPRSTSGGHPTADVLMQSVIGLGEFRLHESQIDGFQIRLFLEDRVREDGQIVLKSLAEGVRLLTKELWPVKLTRTILVVPRRLDENELFVITGPWADAIDSYERIAPSVWRVLFENLAGTWTRYPGYGLELRREQDSWFIDGATRYLALRMMDAAGIANYKQEIKSSYDDYLNNARALMGSLSKSQSWDPETRMLKASLVLKLVDDELKRNQRGDFFGVLKSIRKKSNAVDLSDSLRAAVGGRGLEVLEAYSTELGKSILAADLIGGSFIMAPFSYERIHEETCKQFGQCLLNEKSTNGYRIIVTGRTQAYLENCGCKANQNGGLARRKTVIEHLRANAKRSLLIDVGDFFPFENNSAFLNSSVQQQLMLYVKLMSQMGYNAVALSKNEIRYSVDYLHQILNGTRIPLTNANVLRNGAAVVPTEIRDHLGHLPVRIIGVLDPTPPRIYRRFYEDATSDLVVTEPSEAIRKLLTSSNHSRELTIIVGALQPTRIRELIDANPDIDIVISSERFFIDQSSLPDFMTEHTVEHLLAQHEHSGFYKGALVLYSDQESYGVLSVDFGLSSSRRVSGAKITKIPLNSSVGEDAAARRAIDAYYKTVPTDAGRNGVRPLFQDDPAVRENEYVGAESCGRCHKAEYDHWLTTRHSKAFLTLRHIRRELNGSCLVCHVTGFGRSPGFSLSALHVDGERFGGVQCEICHGPGSQHVVLPSTANIRKAPNEVTCRECHTPEHSNAFVFRERINLVRHTKEFLASEHQ